MKNFKELLNHISEDVRPNSSIVHSTSKAVFVVGAPGSGKDVIIRGIVNEFAIQEINHNQAYYSLYSDKRKGESNQITEKSSLVVTGPATDIDTIVYVNEGLKNLGYHTSMVFVNTTNEISEYRNYRLTKPMVESVRYEKWCVAQENLDVYGDIFEEYMVFDNIYDLENLKESIDSVHTKIKLFLECSCDPKNTKQDISKYSNVKKKGCGKHLNLLFDNNCPTCQLVRKSDKLDDVRDGDVASNSSRIFRTYEQTQPTIKVSPEKKIPNFQKDKDLNVKPKYNKQGGKIIKVDGVGPTYDSKASNSVYPMSGLGDATYREQKEFKCFRKEIVEGLLDGDDASMGVSGTAGNAMDKEKMDTLNNKALRLSPPRIKKKKVE